MELDELLEQEGFAGSQADDNLEWARGRAAQLVAEVGQDTELGPLLDGVSLGAPPPPPPSPAVPQPTDEPVAVSPGTDDDADAVAAEAAPDPLADMDFDGLPGIDEEEDGASDHAASAEQGVPEPVAATGTEPAELPPIPSAAPATTAAADEDEEDIEEIEEIELLDDDDLELVEEDDDEQEDLPPLAPVGDATDGGGDEDELPEWKAALTSAQLGGDAKADEDSGLLRPPAPAEDAEAEAGDDEQPEADGEA